MCMGCFSAKYAPLRNKNKDWFALNHYNFQRRMFMSTRGLLIHWASNISYSACWSSTARTSSSSSHWIVTSSRHLIAHLALNNNHSQKGYQFYIVCIISYDTFVQSHIQRDVIIKREHDSRICRLIFPYMFWGNFRIHRAMVNTKWQV